MHAECKELNTIGSYKAEIRNGFSDRKAVLHGSLTSPVFMSGLYPAAVFDGYEVTSSGKCTHTI